MREVKRVLLEAMIVIVVGAVAGLAANAASSDPLSLTRNYFPKQRFVRQQPETGTQPVSESESSTTKPDSETSSSTQDASQTTSDSSASSSSRDKADGNDPADAQQSTLDIEIEQTTQYLHEIGLQTIQHDEAVEMFEHDYYREGLYLFLDARPASHYRDGHIPGAYSIDHFASDLQSKIDELMPLMQSAIKIVIYCNGGQCEDSELLAFDLLNAGVDLNKVYVYVGGMRQWVEQGRAVETGQRKSPVGEGVWP
jgi:rhodanese-related sulfurtransferase